MTESPAPGLTARITKAFRWRWSADGLSASRRRWIRQTRIERRRALEAEARIAAALALHPADTSNPHGPWCPTCMTAWPCATYRALAPARPTREDGDEP